MMVVVGVLMKIMMEEKMPMTLQWMTEEALQVLPQKVNYPHLRTVWLLIIWTISPSVIQKIA
ncbi:hypothetical protein HHK36_000347 [Tetracentron sinense]|uniref:Uncharacterized protein n=1 Tax=Tetracentron sinense TaxID=13715 RepID=A0A835DQX1_TETSI|nr:hypothetical protein HHK36_000347 [Tetracentron sinense]